MRTSHIIFLSDEIVLSIYYLIFREMRYTLYMHRLQWVSLILLFPSILMMVFLPFDCCFLYCNCLFSRIGWHKVSSWCVLRMVKSKCWDLRFSWWMFVVYFIGCVGRFTTTESDSYIYVEPQQDAKKHGYWTQELNQYEIQIISRLTEAG
jgi:hypothetical protein